MSQGQMVDVMQLPIQDLQKLRQSLGEDVQLIASQLGNLKLAAAKYAQAQEALTEVKQENQDKRIMVPLTSSLYIPGRLSNINNVLVDVGTGFFVEKSVEDANTFFKGKVELVNQNLAKVGAALAGKRRDLDAVSAILQAKLQAAYQSQKDKLNTITE